MADQIRVGIIGAGWPGKAHAKGYESAGGFKLVAVADLIPGRRKGMMDEFKIAKEFADGMELIAEPTIEAVSICAPSHLHAPMAVAALRAGKHVVCEKPPGISVKEARQIEAAATKNNKTVIYGLQRRFGANEQASRQAIEKGYIGNPYHARATWTRTRGIPLGTGWYTEKTKSGGGALADLGLVMLDLAWYLMGQPTPVSAFGVTHKRFAELMPNDVVADVEDAAFALIRFEGGQSLELASSWALNQPPSQNGASCRISGDSGALDVYTGSGAVIYRGFDEKGEAKAASLKLPKTIGHAALMRHFRECIAGAEQPQIGAKEGVTLMQIIEAIYESAEAGKSVKV